AEQRKTPFPLVMDSLCRKITFLRNSIYPRQQMKTSLLILSGRASRMSVIDYQMGMTWLLNHHTFLMTRILQVNRPRNLGVTPTLMRGLVCKMIHHSPPSLPYVQVADTCWSAITIQLRSVTAY